MGTTIAVEKTFFSRKEAAEYLTRRGYVISASTLNKYAHEKRGPDFQRESSRGPSFYSKDDLEEWLLKMRANRKGTPR